MKEMDNSCEYDSQKDEHPASGLGKWLKNSLPKK
jgi:hypothetical protein